MRGLIVGCIAAITAIAPVATAAAPSEGVVVRRTTLLVNDAAASIAFYRDMLGFEVWYEGDGEVTGDGLPVVDAAIGEPTRFVIMKGKDSYIGMVGLLQYGTPKPLPDNSDPPALRAGDMILMIEMAGVDAAVARLEAAGWPIFKDPETVDIKSVSTSWTAKTMFVQDPDGHLIELTERLN